VKELRKMRTTLKLMRATLGIVLGVSMTLVNATAWAAPVVVVPERTRVCMMQDTIMAVPAIPLASNGKTYYGCCEMCKAKIAAEPERYTLARDPVSGAVVDKATAALLSVDGRVFYFESEATRTQFTERLPRAR
jgi:YHS domain-containing protein